MTTTGSATTTTSPFSSREQAALHALRARFPQGHELFSPQELAQLCFLRWLYQTGRLAS